MTIPSALVWIIGLLTIFLVESCSSAPICHKNGGGLYIKFNPCDGKLSNQIRTKTQEISTPFMKKNQIDPNVIVFVVVCGIFLGMGLLLAGVQF